MNKKKTKITTHEHPEQEHVFINMYEINVYNGDGHVFATHQRSITTREEAMTLLKLLSEKFPASEGYGCTLTGYSAGAYILAKTEPRKKTTT